MISGASQLKRYQLQWRPNLPFSPGGDNGVRLYIFGEGNVYTGTDYENLNIQGDLEPNSQAIEGIIDDPNIFTLSDVLKLAQDTTLILPFNTGIALAQEYSPKIVNRVIEHETLSANKITTFGQGIRKIGLNIKIIKAGRNWETYYKGLEALSYLSGKREEYYGSLYLLGFDMFADGTQAIAGKYKVTVSSLNFSQRSSENTVVNANLEMTVLYDYGNYQAQKHRYWGAL